MATPSPKTFVATPSTSGFAARTLVRIVEEVSGPQGVGFDEDHLQPLLLGQLDGALSHRPPSDVIQVDQGHGLEPLL